MFLSTTLILSASALSVSAWKVSDWNGPVGGHTQDEVSAFLKPVHTFRNTGGFGPWKNLDGLYGIPLSSLPESCEVDQVQLFMRHGQRLASTGANSDIVTLVNKFNQNTYNVTDKKFEYLKTWKWTVPGEFLTPWGAQEAFSAGVTFQQTYGHLLPDDYYYNTINNKTGPIITLRTSDQQRVNATATNFAMGFFGEAWVNQTIYNVTPDSKSGYNSTLANSDCPASSTITSLLSANYSSVYQPKIAARLQKYFTNLTIETSDINTWMNACPFESVRLGRTSPICDMFTAEEWVQFGYNYDLSQYHVAGYGSPIGASWGVGWVNEMIARLSDNSSVVDNEHTTVNHTSDSNPTLFNYKSNIYLDFTHDSQLESAITAMGLLNNVYLTSAGPDPDRQWSSGHIAPMGGRLFVERLKCSASELNGTFVRLILNSAVVPLPDCHWSKLEENTGLCSVGDFISSQSYALNGADFANCYKNYTGVAGF